MNVECMVAKVEGEKIQSKQHTIDRMESSEELDIFQTVWEIV